MSSIVFSRFALPNGMQLKNRIVKAAMEENMAEADLTPGPEMIRLYKTWAEGGTGLIITGNVMVDRFAMTGPGGVALEADTDLAPFREWASVAKHNDTRVVMQISHPGRQVFKKMGGKVLAPSEVVLNMGKMSGLFGQPEAMTDDDIQDVICRFVTTAAKAREAGFDGVEVHAAHGYLLAQFLSPLSNQRSDQWGGSLENRARLLVEIVKGIRKECGEHFIVAVKLNSADFQRGGFDIDDAEKVVQMLTPLNVDIVELSGGSYESPAMQGRTADDRTLAREAYFLEFAERIAAKSDIPIMTTGGIRRLDVANKVIHSGVALVGIASALSFTPDLPEKWLHQPNFVGQIPAVNWKDKTLNGLATMAIVKRQLRRLGSGLPPKNNSQTVFTLAVDQVRQGCLTRRYRKTLGINH